MFSMHQVFFFFVLFHSVRSLVITNINHHTPDGCASALIPNPAAQGGSTCAQDTQLSATVSLLLSPSSSPNLTVYAAVLPPGFVLGIPSPSSASTCAVQQSLAPSSLTPSSATFIPTSGWLAPSYQGAGPVNLCWSSSNYPGSWAYTGLKWQVVLPCSKSCTCCQASSESQCLPSASYTCCAAAVLPPGQLCCDPALGIAGVSFGPTGFIVANIVPYGTPFHNNIFWLWVVQRRFLCVCSVRVIVQCGSSGVAATRTARPFGGTVAV